MSDKVQAMDRLLTILIEKGTVFVGRAAIVLVVFTLAWVLAGWAQRGILRAFGRANHVDATLVRFLASAVRYGLLIAALISCLSAFGINATSFAAVLGAAGIAIGLAFQGTLSNFAAGLMLLLFRPFRVGDTIKAGAYSGTVKALELFSTVLVTADNRRVVRVGITAAGIALLDDLRGPVRDCHARQLGHLSRGDLEALVALLRAARLPHEDPDSTWR